MISFDDAVAAVLSLARPLGAERVALADALGRALAEPCAAPHDVPEEDAALMDGYAVAAAATPGEVAVAFEVAAGQVPPRALAPGEAARIFTGAPVPAGADSVVMQEAAVRPDPAAARVRLPAARAGDHVRRRGDDLRAGENAIAAGEELGPAELAMLASFGRAHARVGVRPRVALVSTGDELLEPGDPPRPGAHYESNLVALAAQARGAGAEAVVLGRAPDRIDAIVERLSAAARCDVWVSSGGASGGAYDFAREAFARLGAKWEFEQVAIRPGKPTAFGTAPGEKLVFALPGNPASSMLSFELFVRPALRRLAGHARPLRPRVRAALDGELAPLAGLTFFARGVVARGADGALVFRPSPRQGSMPIASMVGLNAVAVVPPGGERLLRGTPVEVQLLGAPRER